MKFYVFRSLDGDHVDYMADFPISELTQDKSEAAQLSADELDYLDLKYYKWLGFEPVDIDEIGVEFNAEIWFRPPVRNYQPTCWPHNPGEFIKPPRTYEGATGVNSRSI